MMGSKKRFGLRAKWQGHTCLQGLTSLPPISGSFLT